jgi:hypothetical protein
MKVFAILISCLGILFLKDQRAEAQLSRCPSECYPLNSVEAANILENSQSPLFDGLFKWIPDRVGQGFICLDYCPDSELAVSQGIFKAGKCTYTITNTAEADMVGRTTEIVLKRIPAEASSRVRCFRVKSL